MKVVATVFICTVMLAVSLRTDSVKAKEEEEETDVDAGDHGLSNASSRKCDVFNFINFKVGGGGGLGRGGLRKQASAACSYGIIAEVSTQTLYEAKWMREKCKQGVQIGRELCLQETKEGDSIVPVDIIDHFDSASSEHSEEGKEWRTWSQSTCDQQPAPDWTGFQDCFHACQYMHPDCGQTYIGCKVCENDAEVRGEHCQGIRREVTYQKGSRVLMDWTVKPAPKYSFLDACVKGCTAYATLKKEKGGGPACRKGKVRKMMRTLIKEEHAEKCSESGGILEGQVCYCDREAGLECKGRDGHRSSWSHPAQGCLNNEKKSMSGFMSDCEGCVCQQ